MIIGRNRFQSAVLTLSAIAVVSFAAVSSALDVDVSDSSANWIGFMNVFELPANGGGYVFGSGWGVADLNATFDDGASTVTLSPNTIEDPNEFWYQNTTGTAADPMNPGGPGQAGNKSLEANLFQEFGEGTQELTDLVADGMLTFSGEVVSNSFTTAHVAEIFVKEFTPGFASVFEDAIPLVPGPFSIEFPVLGDGGAVQYGFRVRGENVWAGDESPFGNAVIATISSGNPITGDFDGNTLYECADVDALVAEIVAGTNTASFDLNGDSMVNGDDLTAWLAEAGEANIGPEQAYLPGDANLDGFVDVSDLNIWNGTKFGEDQGWCGADFNADGFTDVSDLNIWSGTKFQQSDSVSAVPEPGSMALLLTALLGFGFIRRR